MKRLWGIRHLRFFWVLFHLDWDQVGMIWGPQHEADLRTLGRIWEGKA